MSSGCKVPLSVGYFRGCTWLYYPIFVDCIGDITDKMIVDDEFGGYEPTLFIPCYLVYTLGIIIIDYRNSV